MPSTPVSKPTPWPGASNGPSNELYCYKDLARRFSVDVRTIARWFKPYKLFRPSKGFVRVTPEVLDQFLKDKKL